MTINIVSVIIVLGVLIFFHEFGHFIIARIFNVGVETFSLGFGKRIFGKKIGITDYRVSLIPLGGYVKMVGEDPTAEVSSEEIELSFIHKHVFKRILIVAAGPVFNFLFAIMVFYLIFQIQGMMFLKASIGNVQEDAPAYAAGLKEGDIVKEINGQKISSWEDMSLKIRESNGKPIDMKIERDNLIISFNIEPELKNDKNLFGEDIKRYLIGIAPSGDHFTKSLNPYEAVSQSLSQTYKVTEMLILVIKKLFNGTVSTKTLGGPILIAQMAGEHAKAGIESFISFMALLSINLAILNLLPVPVLDGGHIMFYTIEAIIRRPVSLKVHEIANQIGIFLLMCLMIYVFYNDITRIFS